MNERSEFIHQHSSLNGCGACGAAAKNADATDVSSAARVTEAF